MRIDATTGLGTETTGSAGGLPGGPVSSNAGQAETAQQTQAGVSVDSRCLEHIQAAMAQEDVDSSAVAAAKALLAAGQLDTPEAAARAAENMLKLGM